MWSRKGTNFVLSSAVPNGARNHVVSEDSLDETSAPTSSGASHFSEDSGSDICEHKAYKGAASEDKDRGIINVDMFMDRRIDALGNTFCNFLDGGSFSVDTLSSSGARIRSSSWSHPRSTSEGPAGATKQSYKNTTPPEGLPQEEALRSEHLQDLKDFQEITTPRTRSSSKSMDHSSDSMEAECFLNTVPNAIEQMKSMLLLMPMVQMPVMCVPLQPARDDRTTLVIRNIGNKMDQHDLMQLWPASEGYNIFYIPFSFKKNKNLGFAFINFPDNKSAVEFKERWNGAMHPMKGKGIVIDWAKAQGFEAHMEIIKSYPVMLTKKMSFPPVVYDHRGHNSSYYARALRA
jgi:hypothetical protein